MLVPSALFGVPMRSHLTLLLSPVALAVVCLYSTTKRWTHFTQIFLGLSQLGAEDKSEAKIVPFRKP